MNLTQSCGELGVVIHTCNPSTQGVETEPAKSLRPAWSTYKYPVTNKQNRQSRGAYTLDTSMATANVDFSNSQPV